MNMLTETIEMLRRAKSRPRIAEETGLGLQWMHKLAQGHIKDPGVTKIQRLYEYLKCNQNHSQ